MKLRYFLIILSLVTLQGSVCVCVYTSGEVDSFNAHYSALTVVATCQIWWKFVDNFVTRELVWGRYNLNILSACFTTSNSILDY